jgi:hypothetical protein
MQKRPPEIAPAPPPADAGAQPVRVLLVDNDRFDAELLEHYLRCAGVAARLERVKLPGGGFDLSSTPGPGARLCATIPLHPEEPSP